MDSMRSLNTSLPRSSPHKKQNHPPTELLSAFKSAAQSVTLLYKTAASLDETSRAAGYQDALDDLLAFLDQENLGLGDGEGWQVRQWATERLSSDNELVPEQQPDDEKRARSSSPPVAQRQYSASEPARAGSTPPNLVSSQPAASSQVLSSQPSSIPSGSQPAAFTFQSATPLPTHDVEMGGNGTVQINRPVRFNIPPRNSRKYSSHNGRERTTINSATLLGHGAGAKRKPNPSEYFPDIHNFEDPRDGNGGGGKRGRYT